RTLATIVRQPTEELGRVGIGLVGLEADSVAAKVDVPSFELRNIDTDQCGRLVRVRHERSPSIEVLSPDRREAARHTVTSRATACASARKAGYRGAVGERRISARSLRH